MLGRLIGTGVVAGVEVTYELVGAGGGIDLAIAAGGALKDGAGSAKAPMRCVRGVGRGSYALAPAGTLSIWFCLRGWMEVDAADGTFRLQRGAFLALPSSSAARGVGRDGADWCVVTVPADALARLGRRADLRRTPEPMLLPAAMSITRPLLRALATLLRQARGSSDAANDILAGSLLHAAQQAQSPAEPWIERACGRSAGHRRQVVVRLLSARNRILNQPFMVHDLDTLAAAARYSKSHFVRLFRDVFGTTPHDLVIEARMEMAKRLISDSDLAIAEVAASVGYESRFAFSRLFKKRIGVSASEYRHDAAVAMASAA